MKISTTDPESGNMVRQGKPEGFFYLDHRSVDGKHNLVTDVYVATTARNGDKSQGAREPSPSKTAPKTKRPPRPVVFWFAIRLNQINPALTSIRRTIAAAWARVISSMGSSIPPLPTVIPLQIQAATVWRA